jgi:phosphohistidine phosphatase
VAILYLLRHARAVWPQPGMRDFDRGLDPSGLNDAVALGIHMAREGLFPQKIICSTARRAQETIRELLVGMDTTIAVENTEELYTRDAGGYLEIIRQQIDPGPLLIVGHNPMIEDAALRLVKTGSGGARNRLEFGFPVCALAVIEFPGPFCEVMAGSGKLTDFLTR